jgi:proteasome lid subunit RPN8/RPN11
MMIEKLTLTRSQWEEMRRQVEAESSIEACGLLAGTQTVVQAVIPMCNSLASPVRYRLDPLEQLAAFERIEKEGLELIAIYHSHPNGPPHPSPTDIAEAFYEVVYMIWSRLNGGWQANAFWIADGSFREISLELQM